jgi:O-antigen/teichoic acid export membrane protein
MSLSKAALAKELNTVACLAEVSTPQSRRTADLTQTQIRGSSLLLGGRLISLGINFCAQILMVRYLSVAHYGALAYGLSVVAFLQLFSTLGLQEAVSRYVPVYYENGEYEKLFGTILFAAGVIFGTGILVVATVVGAPGFLSHLLTHEQLALRLLPILIFLVPVEAADAMLDGLFASFAGTRAIFFRKYVLGPGLKLGIVVLLIWRNATVVFLAYGYVAASISGVLMYSWMYLLLLKNQQLLGHIKPRLIKIPTRELLAFIVPGLSSILATVAISTVSIFLLGSIRTMSDVAYFRAVLPLAQLNSVVMASFTLLYTPSAARLFANADYSAVSQLYWRTAVWMSVLSFPIFAMTFSLAQPLTLFLYGARYEHAAPILAVLSFGSYFNVALGFNLQTLKVIDSLHYVTAMSVVCVLLNIVLNLALIPRFGAVGAAIGTASSLIIYNLLMQMGLLSASKMKVFERNYLSIYVTIALSAAGLFSLQFFRFVSIYVALPIAAGVSLYVFASAKKKLKLTEVFPELLSLPFARLFT